MLSLKALNQYVFYIHLNIPPNLAFKHLINEPLVDGSRVLQSKGHDLVTIESAVGDEGSFFLVGLVHLYLIIP